MKKIILTTAALAAISTSAFADMDMGADSFYLRGDVIGSKFTKVNSHKSKTGFGLDLAAGYRAMDNVRVELVYNHAFNPEFKAKGADKSKYKFNADAVLVRAFVDVADLGMAKPYVGAAVGWAQLGVKNTNTTTNVSEKAKNKNNLAWSLHAGAGFGVADGVTLDVGYSYRDYGKTKAVGKAAAAPKYALRSHNVSAGVRFDI